MADKCHDKKIKELFKEPPLSCLIDLVHNYMYCGESIPQAKRILAYKAFVDVTGYKPINFEEIFKDLEKQHGDFINFNSYYIYFPIAVIVIIFLWGLVLVNRLSWAEALFGTITVLIILYIFAMAYRIHGNDYLSNKNQQFAEKAKEIQQNNENIIAYLPQGLLAVACAITCNNRSCWKCNPLLQNNNNNNNIISLSPIKRRRYRKKCTSSDDESSSKDCCAIGDLFSLDTDSSSKSSECTDLVDGCNISSFLSSITSDDKPSSSFSKSSDSDSLFCDNKRRHGTWD